MAAVRKGKTKLKGLAAGGSSMMRLTAMSPLRLPPHRGGIVMGERLLRTSPGGRRFKRDARGRFSR